MPCTRCDHRLSEHIEFGCAMRPGCSGIFSISRGFVDGLVRGMAWTCGQCGTVQLAQLAVPRSEFLAGILGPESLEPAR